MSHLKHKGLMIDCSRNAVMKISTVKKMIDIMKKLGMNTLMLYTEDTYEIEGEPYFGYMRGRYSKAELKELNDYAAGNQIELIPCIQTLAHLNTIMRWPQYAEIRDCNDILCVGEERVYELIEKMFTTLEECFTSRIVNVGMDEAGMIGLGKYLDKHGYQKRLDILGEHLKRVSEIAKKHGFTLCMWSDMFYKLMTGTYYGEESATITQEQAEQIVALVPDNVRLVYWDYWNWDSKHYDEHIENHQKFAKDMWFAGALWNWVGFAPHNAFSMEAGKTAIQSCMKHGVENMIFTMWGDDSAECARFSLLPALYHNVCVMNGVGEAEMKKGFQEMFGISFDDFMLLDYPKTPNDRLNNNADKYAFYNDPFIGIMDMAIPEDLGQKFAACAEKLAPLTTHTEWGYLFDTAKCLADVLELKADLGVRTRNAYQSGNRQAVAELLPIYHEVADRVQSFYVAFEKQWSIENKPYGFEVQDIRIGGLKQRLLHCAERLQNYADGKLERIEELEEQLLNPFGKEGTDIPEDFCVNIWKDIVTVNVV